MYFDDVRIEVNILYATLKKERIRNKQMYIDIYTIDDCVFEWMET